MDDNEQTAKLRSHIQLLSGLRIQIQDLRQLPTSLLKSSGNENLLLPDSTTKVRNEFSRVRSIVERIRSSPVQEALGVARERLGADGADLKPELRYESRKRRRDESFPKSPEPYVANTDDDKERKFPFSENGVTDVEGIRRFAREFNGKNEAKVHLWASDCPKLIVRFMIKDVLTAYMTVVRNSEKKKMFVESVTAFGPREKKGPHCESEYGVYRLVSQQMAQMLEGEGVGIENVVSVLSSYSSLFVGRCRVCSRVVSSEGAVPAVVREWIDHGWSARHVGCRDRGVS